VQSVAKKKNVWQPGQSGNPAGRPIGTRNRFSETFVSDVASIWAQHGIAALEKMVTDEPSRFAEMCSRLIPRDVQVSLSARMPGGLEAEDWQLTIAVLDAVKTALPNAGQRQPAEVMAFVLDAVRAHNAVEIGDSET